MPTIDVRFAVLFKGRRSKDAFKGGAAFLKSYTDVKVSGVFLTAENAKSAENQIQIYTGIFRHGLTQIDMD